MTDARDPAADLVALRDVVDGPLHEIARRLSKFLAERWPHTALVIFTRECTGRPRKVAGDLEMINKVTIGELEEISSAVEPGLPVTTTALVAGEQRPVWVVRDVADTLLVLVPRTSRRRLPEPRLLAAIFGLVATSIRQQVAQASPDYLAESRAASSERERTLAEMAAAHEAVLVSILTTLRSTGLDDGRARLAAADSASAALVALRSAQKSDRALSEEPPPAAFTRLRTEIRQMLRHHEARIEFVAPSRDGRPLPGDIAHAARAMTCTTVLAFAAQPRLARLRIAWTCDDAALHVDVRDQGSGELDTAALRRQLQGRARTLGAGLDLDAAPGWGSRVTIDLPLDPPAEPSGGTRLTTLNRREREVLALLAQGKRNKAIAGELGITESTVKFHVTGVLQKLEVTSRGEAAAVALSAGLGAPAAP
ncbi:LuxR C-terminal-related transcriptional regulator [Amycolatopsis thermophila]|uniref:DNA-binding CsgD family transcriptional regulator/signal transduction histidine kinase n=1 Tax=Amycolatopsis thermophila TaxID=206084 RepID=A0ABU0F2D4_9PSEU|nr:LuxR C-terminal-related transcriptional regulator [Amycolatopsis thermophila]MDQ0381235.1 DNA-binding CsgD family transcriptional regulator/signal transduction histidine kinase [Amycolatopsis thermophila]